VPSVNPFLAVSVPSLRPSLAPSSSSAHYCNDSNNSSKGSKFQLFLQMFLLLPHLSHTSSVWPSLCSRPPCSALQSCDLHTVPHSYRRNRSAKNQNYSTRGCTDIFHSCSQWPLAYRLPSPAPCAGQSTKSLCRRRNLSTCVSSAGHPHPSYSGRQ
jgi:hypothetical protein